MKTTPKKAKIEPDDMSHARIRLRGALNDSIQLEEDYDAELPQRGRPSKNLLLAQQQTQRLLASLPPVGQSASTSTETLRPKKYNTAKKKAALAQQKQPSESFVMKLFDRSLDLSKYTETTPLYPICRAWMANQPRNPNISNYAKDLTPPVKREGNGEEILEKLKRREIHEITELPLAQKTDIKPVPTVLVQKEEDIAASRQLEGGSREELLADHIKRWRSVKTHWHEHTRNYEKERYATTYKIMDMLYKGNARR